jgi:hypothetical protein
MINRKTPDSTKLILDQFRRLMWYANRQRNETGELFSMEDVVDQQLSELGYTQHVGNSMILVTEAGFDVLDSTQPRKASQIVRFKGIEHRFQAMLETNSNLVWLNPDLYVPGKEGTSISADMFSMKKSIIDLRPTAYFFHRDELTINRWSEPLFTLSAMKKNRHPRTCQHTLALSLNPAKVAGAKSNPQSETTSRLTVTTIYKWCLIAKAREVN